MAQMNAARAARDGQRIAWRLSALWIDHSPELALWLRKFSVALGAG